MRKLSVFLLFFILISCSNNPNDKAADTTADNPATPADSGMDQKAQKGLDLVAKSDCFTCHKIAEASTGPSYNDVAAKYQNDPGAVDTLAEKVINGGVGKWGTVPMIAHPSLSKEDAKAMVEYVLSLKK